MLNNKQLVNGFREVGVRNGDVILVHSSLRKLGPVEGGAATVIQALRESIGEEGCLVMPTHSFAVVNERQPIFHETLTPSCVGTLTEIFRKWPDVRRSLHPTHSVAALGNKADDFVAGHELSDTPCSSLTPYGRLKEWGGKVLIIGESLNCCTVFHGCEEWAKMPWAVRNWHVQLYSITKTGVLISVPSRQHGVNTWDRYNELEPHLLRIDALNVFVLGGCHFRLIDVDKAAGWLIGNLLRDPSIILPPDFNEKMYKR